MPSLLVRNFGVIVAGALVALAIAWGDRYQTAPMGDALLVRDTWLGGAVLCDTRTAPGSRQRDVLDCRDALTPAAEAELVTAARRADAEERDRLARFAAQPPVILTLEEAQRRIESHLGRLRAAGGGME